MTNNLAGRDAFLAPAPLKTVTFECPPIGTVQMRELSGSEYSKQVQDWIRPKGKVLPKREQVVWSRLVTLCVVDADGNRILSEKDIDAIEAQPKSVLTKLQTEALKLHGIAQEDENNEDPLEESED